MKTKISEVINAIANDITKLAKDVASKYNIEENDFDKIMQVQISKQNNPVIRLIFNDYIEYTNDTPDRKHSSIDNIRDWALERNIAPDNKTLWDILQILKKNNIAKHTIINMLEKQIELSWMDKWADDLCNAITGELELVFYK